LNRYVEVPLKDQDLQGFDIAFDSSNNVYIVHNRGISKFTLEGTWLGNSYIIKPIYGIAITKVDGVDKIFITSKAYNGNSIFRLDTDLVIEKSYDIGGSKAYCPRIYQSALYVASALSSDKDIWKFNFDLDLISSSVSADPFVQYAISTCKPVSAVDMNPSIIMESIITNSRYGGGIQSNIISSADFSTIFSHCNTNNILVSILLDTQRPLLDWLDTIQAHYQGFLFLG
ncbi:unnamed protein product, partial [marine sediment metagenome]